MNKYKSKMIFAIIELMIIITTIICFALPLWSVSGFGSKNCTNFFCFTGDYTIENIFSVIGCYGTIIVVIMFLLLTIYKIACIKKQSVDSTKIDGIIVSTFCVFNSVCILTSSATYGSSTKATLDFGGYMVSALLMILATVCIIDNLINYGKNNHKQEETNKEEKTTAVVNQTSDADELAKWKKLLDDDAITKEEYEEKKKQILKK